MRHFKHYCKLIFSTIAVVLVFACNSFSAHADPLTAAMLSSSFASGLSFAGFTGLSPDSFANNFSSFIYDIVPWSDIVTAGKAYLTIRDLIGSNNVEIELSPEISTAGERRTESVVSHYAVSPGGTVNTGSFYKLGDYAFNYGSSSNVKYGPFFSPFSGVGTYFVNTDLFLDLQNYDTGYYQSFAHYQSSVSTRMYVYKNQYVGVRAALNISGNNPQSFYFASSLPSGATMSISNNVVPPNISSILSYVSTSVSRSSDSEIITPDGRSNVVTVPASYVSDITYDPGIIINAQATVEAVLDAISEAGIAGDIVDSTYTDAPSPPSSETISDTAYSTLNDTFDEFKEFFGDIFDGITDFKESFGDWVDNVASGWTEVFGDIYSDLHGFKESFGDWVDDVASGWTEIFGDIYSTLSGISSTVSGTIANTLSGISSAVQSLVQTIENADFDFVDAFWKNFLTPFNSLFNTIKSHLSIWHYVVEWLASISSVFTFYLGVFSGAGNTFLLPIYACFAGTVVIAVYRRFGK